MLHVPTVLSENDLRAIADLERRVVAADGGRLKLEWGTLRSRDGTRPGDLLWREGGRLLGFCGSYAFGGPIELAGMVDPQARRRGVGSALLRAALPLAAERGAASVLLVVPRSTDAGREFALRHGGTLDHSEHHLVLVATPPPPGKHSDLLVRDAAAGDVDELLRLLEAAFGPTSDSSTLLPTTPADRQLVVERAGAVIGCLRLSTSGATSTGIYGFAVDPQLRGQGIGRAVLAQVCRQLCAAGPHEVTLEVAVDNEHALGLYTSVGFDRKTTEDYYKVSTEPTT